MDSPRADATYAMGRTAAETQRLIKQAQRTEWLTRHLFEEAGIGAGMRVLDVGSGAGDVAFLAAELVEPTGAVVGVDIDPTVLATARSRAAAAGLAQVQFVEGDFRSIELDGAFDAVVGRAVLMYQADPAEALRGLVCRLKPGGVVAFLEFDYGLWHAYAGSELCPPLLRQHIGLSVEVFRRSGIHLSSGFGLHAAFEQAGLEAGDMWVHAPLGGRDGWAGYEAMVEARRSMLPRIEQYGIATAAEVDVETLAARLRAAVRAHGLPAMSLPRVGAWARKPSA
jgi:SAM-dependent methyltransferase